MEVASGRHLRVLCGKLGGQDQSSQITVRPHIHNSHIFGCPSHLSRVFPITCVAKDSSGRIPDYNDFSFNCSALPGGGCLFELSADPTVTDLTRLALCYMNDAIFLI